LRSADGSGCRRGGGPAGAVTRRDAGAAGTTALAGHRILSPARDHAVRRGGAGTALACVRAVLWPTPRIGRGVLRRPVHADGARTDFVRAAARAGRQGNRGADGIAAAIEGSGMSIEGKRACIIGAGFGGLALALRLQSAGVQTTVVEGRDKP